MKNNVKVAVPAVLLLSLGFIYTHRTSQHIPADFRDAVAGDTFNTSLSGLDKTFTGKPVPAASKAEAYSTLPAVYKQLLKPLPCLKSSCPVQQYEQKQLDNALFYAIHQNDLVVVAQLIGIGASPDAKDIDGYTPLMVALRGNAPIKMIQLLDNGNLDVRGENKISALMIACQRGNTMAVKSLMKRGADIYAVNDEGIAVVAYAANVDIVKLLMSAGLDINTVRAGYTPLIQAVRSDNLKAVEAIISAGADLNVKDENGYTAIFNVNSNSVEITKRLIASGANLNAKGKDGKTALMTFCAYDIIKIPKLLIAAGADLNAKDNNGATALMITNDYELAKSLIDAGAGVNIKDNAGVTALMYAVSAWNYKTAQMLIAAKAEVNAKDIGGNTALQRAVSGPWYIDSKPRVETVQLLVGAGADVNARNTSGTTVLMSAVNKGIDGYTSPAINNVIKFLITSGVDVNARDNNGKTALMYHPWGSNAKQLIDAGADVNAKDKDGNTVLMLAVWGNWSNNLELDGRLSEVVLKAGADSTVKNNAGKTAWDGNVSWDQECLLRKYAKH